MSYFNRAPCCMCRQKVMHTHRHCQETTRWFSGRPDPTLIGRLGFSRQSRVTALILANIKQKAQTWGANISHSQIPSKTKLGGRLEIKH